MKTARFIKAPLPQFCAALTLSTAALVTPLRAEPVEHAESHGRLHAHGLEGSEKQTPGDGAAQSGVRFTCPMHPEVVSDTPGRCPHCGMKLVEQEPTPQLVRQR